MIFKTETLFITKPKTQRNLTMNRVKAMKFDIAVAFESYIMNWNITVAKPPLPTNFRRISFLLYLAKLDNF